MRSSKRAISPKPSRMLQQASRRSCCRICACPKATASACCAPSKEIDADVPVIVMTAYGSIEDAVTAMKEGALDFLAKPVDPDHLLLLVSARPRAAAARHREPADEGGAGGPPRRAAAGRRRSVAAQGLCSLQRAAATDTTVLIEGESGTGKELFARSLHALSAARRRAVCRDQLRGDSGEPARDRAVRPREGGVHRRRRRASRASSRSRTAARCSSTRLATCRYPAGEDPARARREALRARRRHGARCRSTSGWSRPRTAG